jgi:hypothetical protein
MMNIQCLCRVIAESSILLFLVGFAPSGWCQGETDTSLFSQGRTYFSAVAGYGSFNNNDYGILGLGAGYYVVNNLEAGLEGDAWIGSLPHLYQISPSLTYVLPEPWTWKPYLGAFYRRTVYDHDLTPLDSAGGRAGLIYLLSPRSYLSAGVAYEGYIHCDSDVYSSCSEVYPEIGVAFSF